MRWLALVFVVLIVALQYPMWLGKGGWLQVRELDRQLSVQREANAKLKARNDRLDADVGDLKTGYEAIEDRARSELGMVRQDEVFFQTQGKSGPAVGTDAKARGPVASPDAAASNPPATSAAATTAGVAPPNAASSDSTGASASPAQSGSASGMISPVSAPVTPGSAGAAAYAAQRAHAPTHR